MTTSRTPCLAAALLLAGSGPRPAPAAPAAPHTVTRHRLEAAPSVEGATADDVLAAVVRGDADAGIVYTTTMRGAKGVDAVPVPELDNTPALYSISALAAAAEPRGAAAFRSFALSRDGQAVLRGAGLLPIGAK